MNATELMIREHAYHLWDRAGRPEIRSEDFWFAAKAEFERNEETGKQKFAPPFAGLRMFVVKRQLIGEETAGPELLTRCRGDVRRWGI